MANLNYKPCYTYIYGLGNLEHVILNVKHLLKLQTNFDRRYFKESRKKRTLLLSKRVIY